MTNDDATAGALELIRALAPAGHTTNFLAEALRRALIPTPSGRGTWHHVQVIRLAKKHGIPLGIRAVA